MNGVPAARSFEWAKNRWGGDSPEVIQLLSNTSRDVGQGSKNRAVEARFHEDMWGCFIWIRRT
jgi:hypothetical protein